MKTLIEIVCAIVVFAVCLLLTRWMFNAVMATDWPDWLKYFVLLR